MEDRWEKHPLKIKIKAIEKMIRHENDLITNSREQLNLLNSFATISTTQTQRDKQVGAINIESWAQALSFLAKERLSYQEKIRISEDTLEKLSKQKNKLSNEYYRIYNAGKKSGYEVEVSYISKPGEKVQLILDYLVTGVSWTGLYDLRGSSEGGKFRLITYAKIKQSTGEDWTRAQITVSTARPNSSISPGILEPWRIQGANLAQPREPGRRGMGGESDSLPVTTSSDSQATNSSDTSVFTFTLPARETITSDNSEHRVILMQSDLRGAISHVAIPSLSSFVFLKAQIKNSSGMPILWGNINIFLDENFVGSTTLPSGALAGEDFEIFLGADERMQIKRKLIRGDILDTGIFSKKVEVINQWQIEVTNYSKKDRSLEILDQYPIPADPNLVTKFLGSSREDLNKNANGILSWKLLLKSGQMQKFDFSYSIELPRETWDQMQKSFAPNDAKYKINDDMQNNAPSKNLRKQYNLEQMLQK
jgi:uncharacterized protein (TIGR02231 family)